MEEKTSFGYMSGFQKMITFLDTSWCMRSEIVPCLVGPPGIGKTAAVMQHAEKHGSKVVKIVASRCVPSETVGMTMPNNERRSMEIYNSMQLSSLRDGDILFLDELLEADQFVLSTLLTVIESREMADGTPLPDIQIIAATNDTIPPEQLKGNIRQRFMFMRFDLDKKQTMDYIAAKTGLVLDWDVINCLSDGGSDYNFLTPRSLTKLCMWMSAVDEDDMPMVAAIINNMWNNGIGNGIAKARHERDAKTRTPEAQLRKAVADMVPSVVDKMEDFQNCTMSELLEVLQGLDDWDEISKMLSELEVEEIEEKKESEDWISF